jgi:PHD/YefM family antitoxin component YafN of YafNO toxin-antitoxin module
MKSVDALTLRQSLGRVLRQLERGGEPILVERRRQAAAVLISLRDYRERFVDREADAQRRDVVARVKALRFGTKQGRTTLDLLRDIRAGRT